MDAPATDPTSKLMNDLTSDLHRAFQQIDGAETEIAHAMTRWPAHRDALYHAFPLLTPTHRFMGTEFVYRSHCREILKRVATGADTRPGTAAEICCLCAEVSQQIPFNAAAAGLYFRMWAAAFPDHPLDTDRGEHHEALYKSRIDDLEADARQRTRVNDRSLADIDCAGFHHGESVACRFSHP
ncbi:hypothetical protein [Frankia gtarii]|uniref:hypothetical protein n=1 Tax=Frankia gtarii TaxID=2950102 RepID=UPI0021BF57AC|nr:hypothetical protein [Frankia gtarii]